MSAKKYQIDLTNGPLFRKILLFCIPLLLANLLQLTFHIADMIVVGKFSSATALAGVGCAFAVCAVVINVFQALSVGTSVLAARYFGAKDMHRLRQCVHTSIALALFGGIGLMIVGEILTVPILKYIDTPADIFPEALTYLRIIFLAIPAITLYNFGCAVLRATGDTRRPLYYLTAAGVVNVGLNVLFVAGNVRTLSRARVPHNDATQIGYHPDAWRSYFWYPFRGAGQVTYDLSVY